MLFQLSDGMTTIQKRISELFRRVTVHGLSKTVGEPTGEMKDISTYPTMKNQFLSIFQPIDYQGVTQPLLDIR